MRLLMAEKGAAMPLVVVINDIDSHCNGWTFTWGVAARGGSNVCIRTTAAAEMYESIAAHGVTHMCYAPIVFNILLDAKPHERRPIATPVEILTGGAPPPAALLESALYKHRDVVEAAVVAMPHPMWGESPCAFVMLMTAAAVNEEEIIQHCRKNLPHFMVPKKSS